jgi:hypothetical protein
MSVDQLHATEGRVTGQCQRLAAVLTMTRDMLSHAESGDWDTVSSMERQRRAELADCMAQATAPEHGELIAEALAAILHLNEEMMGLLRTARDQVMHESIAQARTRSAIGQYQGVKHAPG